MASRRGLLGLMLAAALPRAARPAAPKTGVALAGDIDVLQRTLAARYAYWDEEVARRWSAARRALHAQHVAIDSPARLAAALEPLVASLRDEHVAVSQRPARPLRRIPTETDVWAAWQGEVARVEAVRIGSEADAVGVQPGDAVQRIQGEPIAAAVDALAKGDTTPAARDWALRHLLAGPWAGAFTVDVARGDGSRRIELERRPPSPPVQASMTLRRIGEARDLGYVRLRNALAQPSFVADFDRALEAAQGSRALILDLRDLDGPGAREVTRAVMGRFAQRPVPWQVHVRRDGGRSVESIEPRDPWASKPLVALVDRWTAGEGEALAAGLAAVGATLVGTPMAGLRGELGSVRLPASRLVVRFPVAHALLPDGTPREALRPAVLVDPAAPSGGPGDPILYQALKVAG